MTVHVPSLRAALAATPVPATGVSGLLLGTPVLTLDGALPVEHLFEGDRIITHDGVARLREIRVGRGILPLLRIEGRSLGAGRPRAAVMVSPGARLHLLGRVRAAAELLGAPGVSIGPCRRVTLFSLIFDRPQIIYAGGLELLSD